MSETLIHGVSQIKISDENRGKNFYEFLKIKIKSIIIKNAN